MAEAEGEESDPELREVVPETLTFLAAMIRSYRLAKRLQVR